MLVELEWGILKDKSDFLYDWNLEFQKNNIEFENTKRITIKSLSEIPKSQIYTVKEIGSKSKF